MLLRAFHLSILLALSSLVAYSQSSDPATVTFTFDFPESQPEHYSVTIQSDGAARYESSGKLAADSDETDSFGLDFTASPNLREKVFSLAAKAGYFQKDLDSHHKNLAFTGKKTLAYKGGKRHGESTYNYATQPPVQALTTLFQSLAMTLEFGRRLHYDHRYQKLAIDEELKRMEEESRTTPLVEVSAIAPILKEIVEDPSVINVSRARAQRFLAHLP
jgi:hypothetical protein